MSLKASTFVFEITVVTVKTERTQEDNIPDVDRRPDFGRLRRQKYSKWREIKNHFYSIRNEKG